MEVRRYLSETLRFTNTGGAVWLATWHTNTKNMQNTREMDQTASGNENIRVHVTFIMFIIHFPAQE